MTSPDQHGSLAPPPLSVVDMLSQHSEPELIDLKMKLQKQIDRLQFEVDQFNRALELKAAISDD